ncbi:hypothetical protein GIS00_25265 [Nakamurella sp. YIM 132087]|uniref:VWFA domain-containing protein n=1 Tax=Nakamurella alba TaxID=2665158 RepID=A0A7K1FSV8_9ACTN|nr:hypothetical protein [Nakamurella alba]MTD17245.1 hypothetical protein [Nakamurella alba]
MPEVPGRYRYGSFSGGEDPLKPPFDVRAAVDELGEKVLAGSSVRDAMREMLRRGLSGRKGLDELRKQIRQRRRQLQRSGRLSGALDQVRQMLDQALAAEREQLGAEDTDAARLAEMTLDDLPDDTASAVKGLQDYQWHSEEARQQFEQIGQMLREQVLDRQFAGMKQALQGNDPEAMKAIQAMLGDLNEMLASHARGEDVTDRFSSFMDKHGRFFPENPENIDDLIDLLARRQADAERLMRSLTPEQRAEMQQLIEQAMQDVDLESQLSQLQDNLTALRPGMMRGARPMDVDGEEGLGYGEAVGVMSDLADLESLDRQLGQDYPGSTLDDVDVEALERQLPPSAAADLKALRDLEREMERQGYLTRDAGDLGLSPKALRRLGETALKRIFQQLTGQDSGSHDDRRTGVAEERTGAFVPWEIGSERPIDAVRTVQNAVTRRARAGDGFGDFPLDLQVTDFEAAETEKRTAAAVALCVDLSFSMVMEDRWAPMKQTALALAHLVSTRFRSDALQIIGFDLVARHMSVQELAVAEPEWVKGTNLQHALQLAQRHVRRHPEAEPVILVVTDGEPTAHIDTDGTPRFQWPPSAESVRATVAEVDQVTRSGATLNIFMLGDDPGLARFMDSVARRSGGRVFTPELGQLGQYVVSDYLRARQGRRRSA